MRYQPSVPTVFIPIILRDAFESLGAFFITGCCVPPNSFLNPGKRKKTQDMALPLLHLMASGVNEHADITRPVAFPTKLILVN